MTYSLDFRQKVIAVRTREQLSIEVAAERFDVGKATLTRWLRQLEPKAKRERSCPKIPTDALLADVQRYPDTYQHERAKRWGVSATGMAKALARNGITRKKRR